MRNHKRISKVIWILSLILILETMNLSLISIKSSAAQLSGNSVLEYSASIDEKTAYSVEDLNSILIKQFQQREKNFTVRYKGDTSNLKSLIGSTIDGILKSDDYLQSCINSYQFGYKGVRNDVTISFELSFYTTKIQEDYVNLQVTAILKDIIKVSMNDDQKEKVIHDYIVTHIAYDTTLSRFSAYEALKNGTTVCSGYAQLAYKMLNESGIETKIVVGTGNGEDHAWNLVKLNDIWYHLDCTWDDPVPDVMGRIRYNYFNLNDSTILKDHVFVKADYPASNHIYSAKSPIIVEKEFVGLTKPYKDTAVVATKEWNINFNKQVDEVSLKDKIFICKKGTSVYFPIILQLSEDKKTVRIIHNKPFELGGNYTIYINKNINGIYGNANLEASVKRDFIISN